MMVRTTLALSFIALLAVLTGAGAGCAPGRSEAPNEPNEPPPEPNPKLVTEIEARNRDLERAYASGDMLGVAAVYTDDAVMLSPSGKRWEGREAIDAYWQGIEPPIDWQLEAFSVEGGDTMAVQRGRSTLVYIDDGGARHTSVVEFMLVWTRLDTSTTWRISVDSYW